ncbi:hypothetical protein RJ639_009141 [Escallonia herrerae]|uniref:Uncharacterized protein n=1 Tax=Escallonia herrerae TaxID=1293975 RepID=A0AA88VSX1_9ASTE|nr:hypothetical protein RJ639_009141 [Escallonia herrerae]
MNQKFGGKQPTGTPSLAWSCVVVVASLLTGASVVHNFFKPDLTLPPVESAHGVKQEQPEKEIIQGLARNRQSCKKVDIPMHGGRYVLLAVQNKQTALLFRKQ